MEFMVIDYIFSAIILIFAVIGLAKGFIDTIFGKLSWILGLLFSFLLYDFVSQKILTGIENVVLSNILGFLIVFVVVFLIVKLIQMIFSQVFEWSPLKSLDRVLGFFFGVIEGLVIVLAIIFVLTVQPFFSVENLLNNSFYYGLFDSFFKTVNFKATKNIA